MAFRFRRSIKIAPGIRVNLSKRGVSVSAGPRGASMSVGRHGVYNNVGIPGTGVSFRNRMDKTSASRTCSTTDLVRSHSDQSSTNVNLLLDDLGNVRATDKDGNDLPAEFIRVLREKHDESVTNWLNETAQSINIEIDALLWIHHDTPDPEEEIVFHEVPFDTPKSESPKVTSLGLLGHVFKSIRARIEKENQADLDQHKQDVADWECARETHAQQQASQRQLVDVLRMQDVDAMSDFLEQCLDSIDWPRETNISFDITSLSEAFIDVDLPEIEDIPTRQATVAKRGYKLNIKDISDTQKRHNYAEHVHGIGFRIIGECFYALPTVKKITLSAYSQRHSKTSGDIVDEYLYSVIIARDQWRKINFKKLSHIDLIQAFDQFNLRRSITKTGVFKPIEPFGPVNVPT